MKFVSVKSNYYTKNQAKKIEENRKTLRNFSQSIQSSMAQSMIKKNKLTKIERIEVDEDDN
jgi:hypothetical protein